ncbi:MAG: peptide/nickel transport system ATP-binding protein, partial [Patiriisocius sp.]
MNTSANASSEEYVLSVDGLCVGAQERRAGHVSILQDISFSIAPGKVTALIGESGSGKTTIALACLGYSRAGCNITAGRVQLGKQDILSLTTSERRKLRGREVAYIAQSAAAAFNSALRINRQVTEPAVQNKLLSQQDAERKAQVLYRELDLPDPENIGERYPHQVSGGQLQRLMAAMAMICDPRLL